MAVENGHLEVVDLLLSKGAKVDEVSKFMRYMYTTTLCHVASYIVNIIIFNDKILKGANSEIIYISCSYYQHGLFSIDYTHHYIKHCLAILFI